MRKEEQAEISTEGPLGTKLSVRGPIGILALAGLLMLLGYMLLHHETDTKDRQTQVIQKVEQVNANFEKKIDEVIYVLTLSDADRKGLKLDMPESLRKKRGGQ
jgi:hypothetical protein